MSKQEDFGRPEKPLEKTREVDNEARISKKAEMKRKFNRNQKRINLWDIQLSSFNILGYLHISFCGAPTRLDIIELSNFLLQHKNQSSERQNCV